VQGKDTVEGCNGRVVELQGKDRVVGLQRKDTVHGRGVREDKVDYVTCALYVR
jgi:hypothetical protein